MFKRKLWFLKVRVRLTAMVFKATFNNISVIAWGSVYWWRKPEYPENTSDLPQVTDELFYVILYRGYYATGAILKNQIDKCSTRKMVLKTFC